MTDQISSSSVPHQLQMQSQHFSQDLDTTFNITEHERTFLCNILVDNFCVTTRIGSIHQEKDWVYRMKHSSIL